ncbi:MAG: class I SAM-dependent methyltransferase [Bacteroidales bacterium]
MNCLLCDTPSRFFAQQHNGLYYACPNCKGIFMSPDDFPKKAMEKARYEEHNNDVYDPRYQKFVSPVVNAVLRDFSARHHGLDFGAGTGPVISKMLKEKNYQIQQYDPFFWPATQALENTYDYIVCCEVIEHFQQPKKEFEFLRKLLKENGKLYCMTTIYHPGIDFKTWFYKNDPTHVFFYQKETLQFISYKLQLFSDVQIIRNLIVYK